MVNKDIKYIIKRETYRVWKVFNMKVGATYTVFEHGDRATPYYTCGCPYFARHRGNKICKHIKFITQEEQSNGL